MTKLKAYFISIVLAAGILLTGCGTENMAAANQISSETKTFSLNDIPAYTGRPYVVIHDNVPFFTEEDISTESFESYSDLDDLGRCGPAFANIGTDLLPTEKRGNIGQVKPSGWQTVKYDFVDGKYLYNRCHLIGFQLTAENANEENLITGTRYMNVEGMLPFENMTADYIKETKNHVLYRVTPIFTDENLVASGVLMEARSVEDDGEGILFNVFVYNVQPGVSIDYKTGESRLSDSDGEQTKSAGTEGTDHGAGDTAEQKEGNGSADNAEHTYILNTNSHKFHQPSCSGVVKMKEENKESYTGNRDELISQGYSPCGICKP
ncbi:hypothetical protein GPL15_08640 [Clostridium sp. MCC353]|nr:hypothetical protein [Clostridium sp. MCC353]